MRLGLLFLRVMSAASTSTAVDGPPEPMTMPVRSLVMSFSSRPGSSNENVQAFSVSATSTAGTARLWNVAGKCAAIATEGNRSNRDSSSSRRAVGPRRSRQGVRFMSTPFRRPAIPSVAARGAGSPEESRAGW